MLKNWKAWPIVQPIIGLLFSRKFLVLVFACLASYGLNVTAETQALVFAIAAGILAITVAWEDAAAKRGGSG